LPSIIIGINPTKVIPCCDAIKPAVGNTAKVGIGGTMVSIKAARNIPS